MFDPVLDRKPVGFSGRPMIALLFAVGMGSVWYYIGRWLGLPEPIQPIISCGTVWTIAFLWYRAEKPK